MVTWIAELLPYIKTWMDQIIVIVLTNQIISIFFAIFIVNKISKLLQKIR